MNIFNQCLMFCIVYWCIDMLNYAVASVHYEETVADMRSANTVINPGAVYMLIRETVL